MPLQQISVSTVDWNKEISSQRRSGEWKIHEPVFTTSGSGDTKMERCPSQSSTLSNNNDICRICHCEGDSDAPLIAPCYCAGSLRYVHQACLQQWIKSSDIRCCELCKFTFVMQSKLKPVNQWESLGMTAVERRRLLCSVLFHAVALGCVVWSLYILIDRTADEMQRGILEWPFWTKLVVVAIGFTGGAVFMYIQCKVYLHLCRRWRAFNRVIYVQDAPEKVSLAQTAQDSFAPPTCCGIERRADALLVPLDPCLGPRPANVAAPVAANAKAFFVDETRPSSTVAKEDHEERKRLLGSNTDRSAIVPVHERGFAEARDEEKRNVSATSERGEGAMAAGKQDTTSLGSQSSLLAQRFNEPNLEK